MKSKIMLKQARQMSVSERIEDVKGLFREVKLHRTPEYVKALKEVNDLLSGKKM